MALPQANSQPPRRGAPQTAASGSASICRTLPTALRLFANTDRSVACPFRPAHTPGVRARGHCAQTSTSIGMRSYTMRRRNAATPMGGPNAAWSAAPPAIGRCIRWRRRGAISIRYRDERRQQQLGNGEWRVTGRQRCNPAACAKNVACIAVNAPCTAASGDPYTVSRRGVSSARNRAANRSPKVWICAMAAAESA